MPCGIGPPQKPLWPHVQQPPGQAIAVQSAAIGVQHHKTIRAHGHQHAQGLDGAASVNLENGHVSQAAPVVAQGVLNGSGCAKAHQIASHASQSTRQCGLADAHVFKELARTHWPVGQLQTDALSVGGHGLNEIPNGYLN